MTFYVMEKFCYFFFTFGPSDLYTYNLDLRSYGQLLSLFFLVISGKVTQRVFINLILHVKNYILWKAKNFEHKI